MFWHIPGLSTLSPVDTILDKDNHTLEELLDEDEIIQECKALNPRLINFLRERVQVEHLLQYIVEEAPEDADQRRTFKFPFIACEIFTCEVDIILKTLVEDEELMSLLFSFLEPKDTHCLMLAGYFSKVVICLMLRKTVPFMNYIQAHQDIFQKLVDLIGITSIMEVLIRMIGADESMCTSYMDAMQWLEDTDVLEVIVDKFSSSDFPEVHANAAETLCAIIRYAPHVLAAKITSPSFIGRLFRHALEESRPKSVLVYSLSVCISLLDPKRLTLNPFHIYNRQLTQGPAISANPEKVEGILENLGDLLKVLDVSCSVDVLPTTYGKLQPPLGKHRLKVVDFISVLLTVGSEAAEKDLIRLGAIQRILELFFEYPFNNFLHHHVENIIVSVLESKKMLLIDHLLHDCNLVQKILGAEKTFKLENDPNMPTVPAVDKSPPSTGYIGHLTHISNKLVQLADGNSEVELHLQENAEWADWHTEVLLKRNTVENVYQWSCGRPTALQYQTRDSDDDEFRDRDYDVPALASNLSQAFQYGIYSNDDTEEGRSSFERDYEDGYFDDESAEVVISSLRLGDGQGSGSLFTNSNCFAFEDHTMDSTSSIVSPSPNMEETNLISSNDDEVMVDEDNDRETKPSSQAPETEPNTEEPRSAVSSDIPPGDLCKDTEVSVHDKQVMSDGGPSDGDQPPSHLPNDEVGIDSKDQADSTVPDLAETSVSSTYASAENLDARIEDSTESSNENSSSDGSKISEPKEENSTSEPSALDDEIVGSETIAMAGDIVKKETGKDDA